MRGSLRALLCAAGCCIAVTARADVPVSARALVERYVTVTGGRAALEADTLLHAQGHMTDAAMSGTFEEWRRGTDHVLRNEHLGMLRTRIGYDGTRGWTTDFTSRKVGPLEGKDLEALRAEAWFASEQWARDTTTHLTLGSSSFLSGRTLRAVEVTPPIGPRQTLWFDDRSGLLARITHRRDQYDWNEDLSVWKTLAGRKRATVATTGLKEFAASFHKVELDSLTAEAPPGREPFSPPASTAAPVSWQGARWKIELPFRYQRGSVWVSLSVNGAPPAEFILDTGAFNTCLDRGYAQTLGLSAEGEHVAEGVGGYDTFGFTQLRSLRWGASPTKAVELHDLRAGVIELQDGMSSVEWGRTAGLIGYDVLSRFTLELDFDRQVLTLYDPATYTHSGPGTPIPMTLNGNVPSVEATLNGRCKGTYIVDVGNASVLSVGAEQVMKCGLLEHQAQGGAALGRRHRRRVRRERVPARLAATGTVPLHGAGRRADDASSGRCRQQGHPGQHRHHRARALPLHVRLRARHAVAGAGRALRAARGVHAQRAVVHALGGRGGGVRRGAAIRPPRTRG